MNDSITVWGLHVVPSRFAEDGFWVVVKIGAEQFRSRRFDAEDEMRTLAEKIAKIFDTSVLNSIQ